MRLKTGIWGLRWPGGLPAVRTLQSHPLLWAGLGTLVVAALALGCTSGDTGGSSSVPTHPGTTGISTMFRNDPARTGLFPDTGALPTGQLAWKFKTGGFVRSSPAVSGNVVYVGGNDKYIYALDAASGTQRWKFKTGGAIWSSPAVSGGLVYVGGMDGWVYALDAASGTLRWKFKTGDSVYSSPAVSGALVYIGSWDDYLYALDAATGTVRWKFVPGDFVESPPAVSGGLVYVGSDDGYLYALK